MYLQEIDRAVLGGEYMDRQKAWDELDRESRDVKIDIRSLMRGTPQSLLERPLPG